MWRLLTERETVLSSSLSLSLKWNLLMTWFKSQIRDILYHMMLMIPWFLYLMLKMKKNMSLFKKIHVFNQIFSGDRYPRLVDYLCINRDDTATWRTYSMVHNGIKRWSGKKTDLFLSWMCILTELMLLMDSIYGIEKRSNDMSLLL